MSDKNASNQQNRKAIRELAGRTTRALGYSKTYGEKIAPYWHPQDEEIDQIRDFIRRFDAQEKASQQEKEQQAELRRQRKALQKAYSELLAEDSEEKRLRRLNQEYTQLQNQISAIEGSFDSEAEAKEIQKQRRSQRMLQSRLEKVARREKRWKEAQEKKERWETIKANQVTYVGGEYNHYLYAKLREAEVEEYRSKQATMGLPSMLRSKDLADALGIDIPELQFLCYDRKLSDVRHYQYFRIPKKTGGFRKISAPMPRLKSAQTWILTNILYRIPQLDCVHGFVPGRSIVTNAEPHVGKNVLVNFDLQNFFPSIQLKRVLDFFTTYYPPSVAYLLALICTERKTLAIRLDGEIQYLAQGERVLPQGSPASPAIANLIARDLDKRLLQLGEELGFTYTRYADDLSFSSSTNHSVGPLIRETQNIVQFENFILHPRKTRVMRKGSRQEVTGIIVNEKINIDRRSLRRFRAFLHQLEQNGPENVSWHGESAILDKAIGFASFIHMVRPDMGKNLLENAVRIAGKYR